MALLQQMCMWPKNEILTDIVILNDVTFEGCWTRLIQHSARRGTEVKHVKVSVSLSPCSSSARCLLLWTSSWRRWRASCRPASGTNSPASDPDRTGPDQNQTKDQEPTSIQTETVELKPRTLIWTGLTHLCAKNTEFKPNRGRRGGGGGMRQKGKTMDSRIVFDFIWYVCVFWVFNHLKLFFCCTKTGDQLPSLKKKKWEDKKYNKGLFVYCCNPASSRHFHSADRKRATLQFKTAEHHVELRGI